MKALRSTSLSIAIASIVTLSGCSTSSELPVPVMVPSEAAVDGTVDQTETIEPLMSSGSGELKLDADYSSILEALAAYRLESQAEEVMLLGDSAALTAIDSTLLDAATFDVLDREETLTPALVKTSYTCELGGEMIIENGSLVLDEPEYTHRVSLDTYHFDQCRISGNGEQVFNGSLSVKNDYVSGRHFSVRKGFVDWQGFDWQQDSGLQISSDAAIEYYNFNSFDSQQYRNASIREFSMINGNDIVEKVENALFRQTAESSANGGVNDYAMSVSGTVTNASGIAVQVSTDPEVSSHLAAASLGIDSTFDGQVRFVADDGSELALTAVRDSQAASLRMDVEYRNATGNASSHSAQAYPELPFNAL